MKTLTAIVSGTLVLILGTFVPQMGIAQELPASVGTGMLVSKTDSPVPCGVVGAVQNLKEFTNSTGEITKVQLYIRTSALYFDDYYDDHVSPEVVAVDPILTAKLFAGPVTVALGIGAQWEIVSGADNYLPVMGGEVGWQAIPEYVSVNAGCYYLPRGEHQADYVLPTISLGLDGPKLVEAFTGWLTE